MSLSTEVNQRLSISGTGLITGLPVSVEITPGHPGQGIVFQLEDALPIPARIESVVHTGRGVTLGEIANGKPTGKTLSIVEHFLCAASLAGLSDLSVSVSGAPELPILDGSAEPWLKALTQTFKVQNQTHSDISLSQAVFYRHIQPDHDVEDVSLYAIPAEHFAITYAINFPHEAFQSRWARWSIQEQDAQNLSNARTFGMLSELPVLQAQGLAKGVSLENTLGLTDDGGYTSPLRVEEEPIRHKMIDLIGDLSLLGINPLRLKAHIFAMNAGHTSHLQFARKLQQALQ